MTKEALIRIINALPLADLTPIDTLYELRGDFINLPLVLPSGQTVRFWKDDALYWGAESCRKNSDRCYGFASDGKCLLVCEYGENGADPELAFYCRLPDAADPA